MNCEGSTRRCDISLKNRSMMNGSGLRSVAAGGVPAPVSHEGVICWRQVMDGDSDDVAVEGGSLHFSLASV